MNKVSRLAPFALALLAALVTRASFAQSSCSSDGVPHPVALLERFINADCESCWSDAKTPAAARGELAVDWVLPGSRGDDAPLAAAARRDGAMRLAALRRKTPAASDSMRQRALGKEPLRVAHGLPFYGYIGASIELKPGRSGRWKAWLLLVETLPAGTEGTPVERNLVRNTLQVDWDGKAAPGKGETRELFESRPMNIPDGVKAERLRVVGWIEDSHGGVRAIAQSRCTPEDGKG
jgi:hypothetical protein